MKRFAVFDIDGTLIRWQLFHAIVHSLGKHGYIPPEAHSRITAARLAWKTRASEDEFGAYEAVLIKEYRAGLPNIGSEQYARIVQEVFDEYKDQTYTYTRELIRRLRHKGYVLLAISGSHHEIIQELAKYYGFDAAIGAALEQVDGKFSGKIDSPVFDKAKALMQLMDKRQLSRTDSIGVGDSASDVPMLQLVDNPIVFNPDKNMFAAASVRRWKVVVERKNMIYELEPDEDGYRLKA